MNVALCAAFLEEDVWENRLMAAIFPHRVELTECNSATGLLPLLELKSFSFLVVALNGVAGVESVRQIRKKAPHVPLLWISDEDYSLLGYQYHVSNFLCKPVSDAQLREAVTGCLRFLEKEESEAMPY
ncbi:response regulator [Fusibacter sp. 3D3]|uniref:response regulator n=1 Tax=Fusibacter sp. 3D3 TaxID=1048380 RepID=UPI000852EA30|nr:response regulator [Fusibacter sp. 3D3]GAU77725.1 hypothetical protein F3D3_2354 [Fusibacter sp. 3D3]